MGCRELLRKYSSLADILVKSLRCRTPLADVSGVFFIANASGVDNVRKKR